MHRVVRRNRPALLSAWIISAEFGLIDETCPIPDYDRAMTLKRACELEQVVSQELDRRLRTEHFAGIFVNLGAHYARTLNASVVLPHLRAAGFVEEAHGGIGSRLRQTKQWLLACVETRNHKSDGQEGGGIHDHSRGYPPGGS